MNSNMRKRACEIMVSMVSMVSMVMSSSKDHLIHTEGWTEATVHFSNYNLSIHIELD